MGGFFYEYFEPREEVCGLVKLFKIFEVPSFLGNAHLERARGVKLSRRVQLKLWSEAVMSLISLMSDRQCN